MNEENQTCLQQRVFGRFSVPRKMPFKIVQPPFRKFSKYERDGHWNEKERLKYTVFIGFFKTLLEDPELKKEARIYEMMSDMIITRNASQCRSHHQKMQKYRTNISDIMASVTHKYEPSVYARIEEKYTLFIKTLLENADKYVRAPTKETKNNPKEVTDTSSRKRSLRGKKDQQPSEEVDNSKRREQQGLENNEADNEKGMEEVVKEQYLDEKDSKTLSKKGEENKKNQSDNDQSSSKKEEQPEINSFIQEKEEEAMEELRTPKASLSSMHPIQSENILLPFESESLHPLLNTRRSGESQQSLTENIRVWQEERERCMIQARDLLVR